MVAKLQDEDTFDALYADWDNEEADEINPEYGPSLTISSRDWTVETIVSQIRAGTISLNPKYQRRNVWDDARRSRLIESLLLGIPVPEVILAEDPENKRAYAVIDGKQRLLTLTGFLRPKSTPTWKTAKLTGLRILDDLNGKTFENLQDEGRWSRMLLNSSIRTSFITNYSSDDVLYDIFYRLNTGSVPLSTQELRQALNKGEFADYLIEITNKAGQPLHRVMGLSEPDIRLRDSELILRFITLYLFGKKYEGNLKKFLDDYMGTINDQWDAYKDTVDNIYNEFNKSIEVLISVLGSPKHVGRRKLPERFDYRFNKVIFEVQVYFFLDLIGVNITQNKKEAFINRFTELCQNADFRFSLDSTTKGLNAYRIRYSMFRNIMQEVFEIEFREHPFH